MAGTQDLGNKLFKFDLQRFEDETWTFENNTAFYGTTDNVIVAVEGVTSTDGLTIDTENKIVTVKESSLNQSADVTISKGYKLALDESVTQATMPTLTEQPILIRQEFPQLRRAIFSKTIE